MRKVILTLVICITLIFAQISILLCAEQKDNFSFRNNISWGMSRDEVKGREYVGLLEEDRGFTVSYKDELFGCETTLSYAFYNNKLYEARYTLSKYQSGPIILTTCPYQYPVSEAYRIAYRKIIDALTDKYGEPKSKTSKHIIWQMDDTEIWLDISSGCVMYKNIIIGYELQKTLEGWLLVEEFNKKNAEETKEAKDKKYNSKL